MLVISLSLQDLLAPSLAMKQALLSTEICSLSWNDCRKDQLTKKEAVTEFTCKQW